MANQLLYICTGLPKDEIVEIQKKQVKFSSNALVTPSIFHHNILEGLSTNYDDVTVLVGAPISYKSFKILRYKSKTKRSKYKYIIPSFLNIPFIKQFIISFKMFFIIFNWCIKNRSENKNIIVDGTFLTALLPLHICNLIFNNRTTSIIVDVYDFMKPNSGIFNIIYMHLLSKVNSFVFVTEYVQKLINKKDKKYMIMEGVVDDSLIINDLQDNIDNICLYAGGLQTAYGIKNLVDAFHQLKNDYQLHLYGNGDAIDYIKEIGQIDPRIKYMGIVSHDELIKIERSCKLLINPRPIQGQLDTRYNFPSKLMEYMQSGRPVVTTKLLGIPNCYDNLMFYFKDDTIEGIKTTLEQLLDLDELELKKVAVQAKNFVNTNKTSKVIGKEIYNLTNEVVK